MSLEAARAELELVRVGFRASDRVKLNWVDATGCMPLMVCETYPEAMNRLGINSDMILSVARDASTTHDTGHR